MQHFSYGSTETDHLKQRDPVLGSVIENIGFIKREVTPDLFTALVRSIVAQQISNKAAATVWGRLRESLLEISPQSIANTDIADIQRCGLSTRKAGYIKNIGEKACSGELDCATLGLMSDEDIIKKLSDLHGVGVWTAEMLLIFSLARPDVVSWGDFAIRRGMMTMYGLEGLTKAQFNEYRKTYSPYGTVASLYLWAVSNALPAR